MGPADVTSLATNTQVVGRGTDEHADERCLTHLVRQMETALLQARTFDTLALADSLARLTGG
jgi:hypothetical protein